MRASAFQLAVGAGALQRLGAPHEPGETAALGVGPGGLSVLERGGGHIIARLLIVEDVGDLRAIGAVLLLLARLAFCREPLGPGGEDRLRRPRA